MKRGALTGLCVDANLPDFTSDFKSETFPLHDIVDIKQWEINYKKVLTDEDDLDRDGEWMYEVDQKFRFFIVCEAARADIGDLMRDIKTKVPNSDKLKFIVIE